MRNQLGSWGLVALMIVCLTSVRAAWGQAVVKAESPMQMKQLEFLLGSWQGTGTISQGPNQQADAQVSEQAQFKLGGSVLLIEGRGTVATGGQERVVHDALALITFDQSKDRFTMRTYRAGGEMLEPEITVTPNKIVWSFEEPKRKGRIRFTMSVDGDGTWHETGQYSPDGKNWYEFLKMKLQKAVKNH